jgi:hypothetical protein
MADKKEIQFTLSPSNNEVILREGQAQIIKEPEIIFIEGILNSPLKWLQKRAKTITELEAYILVDRNALNIHLVTDEVNFYRTEVKGKLELHPKFLLFGINGGVYITAFAMAELIKMNRSFFDNHTTAMELVTALKNFKATVNKEIEKADNSRGDKKILIDQVVKSNIPETFVLKLPIFKGEPKHDIEVEVYFNPDDLTCTLISPQANDKLEETRDSAIDNVLKEIKAITNDIAIIEK